MSFKTTNKQQSHVLTQKTKRGGRHCRCSLATSKRLHSPPSRPEALRAAGPLSRADLPGHVPTELSGKDNAVIILPIVQALTCHSSWESFAVSSSQDFSGPCSVLYSIENIVIKGDLTCSKMAAIKWREWRGAVLEAERKPQPLQQRAFSGSVGSLFGCHKENTGCVTVA